MTEGTIIHDSDPVADLFAEQARERDLAVDRLAAVNQTLNRYGAPTHDKDGAKLNANGRLVDFLAARTEQSGAEEFIEAADWLFRCLQDVIEHKVVRGLPEAEGSYHRTRALLVTRDTESGTKP